MKHTKFAVIALALAVILIGAVVPAAAQDDNPTYPANTITVIGMGQAYGTPDIATMDIGVEAEDPDVSVALNKADTQMAVIINTLVEVGIAREDIRTTTLNVYRQMSGANVPPFLVPPTPVPGPEEEAVPVFHVTYQINVVIRDTSQLAEVIQGAVDAGATNLYGPNFGIDDRAALEREARAAAMEDAQARAAQYAELVGAALGDAIIVTESFGGGYSPDLGAIPSSFSGVGMGSISPGQLGVSVQVQVVYPIER